MKSTWRPSLSVKEALAICGSLSNPGKMPGHGYALQTGQLPTTTSESSLSLLLRPARQIPISQCESSDGETNSKPPEDRAARLRGVH
jgi:hypothetical protein